MQKRKKNTEKVNSKVLKTKIGRKMLLLRRKWVII